MPRPLALLIGLVLALAAPVASQAQTTSDTPVQVVAQTDDEGVVLHYRLPGPVARFEFADHDIIRDLWTVTTPGLGLADGAVSGSAPFDAFDIRIRPDAAEVDRIYQGLSRIGSGRVLYGPGLKSAAGETVLTFDLAADQIALPAGDPISGYAYVGPAAQVVVDPRGDVAIGANVDAELAEPLRRTFFASMAFYQQHLDAGLPFRPALLVSVDSPGPTTFRGDVTGSGMISLRFTGDAWRGAGDQLTTFVWHEAFHLWNGHAVVDRDGDTDPWLHEGGAEYAALLGAVSTGDLSEPEGRAVLTRHLNRCREILGDRNLNPASLRSGSGPYACGALIQWLADLELRKTGSDGLALWKAILAAARSDPAGYGVTEFRAGLAPDSAVAVLLDGPGPTRWQAIQDRLAGLGVTLMNQPSDKDFQGAALFHVAKRNCKTGSYGFYDTPGELKLDGADCGVLSGEPIIDMVEGFDPQTQGRAMFDAVQARCASGQAIRYAARDGRVLEAVCDAPLVAPTVWAVTAAPPLALPPTVPDAPA